MYGFGVNKLGSIISQTRPTFSLDFASEPALDPRVDFTRASTGTYLDSDGLLKTASVNTPRIEYDADGNLLGLLVEEARTNLLTYSEDFSNAAWITVGAILTEDDAIAPDGSLSAFKYVASIGPESVFFLQDSPITSGVVYTQTVYAKAGETTWLQITPSSGFAFKFQNYDLANGVLGDSDHTGTASITPVGNGWYRCSLTVTAIASVPGRMSLTWMSGDDGRSDSDATFSPDGTSGFYIWGAQLEEGSFPTSYIPTSGSTATRSADVASLSTSAFGYNQSAGSVVVDFDASKWIGLPSDASFYRVVEFGGNTGSNADGIFRDAANNNARYRFNEDDAVTAALGAANLGPVSVGGNKIGFGLESGNNYIVMDGATDGSGTGTAATNVYNVLAIGQAPAANHFINGHIKSLKYYPRRLTNAQLQALTS